MTKANRVWIELDPPVNAKDGEAKAKLLSTMLRKLGYDTGSYDPITYVPMRGYYCVTLDSAGSYQELLDNGHWFNLDYFIKD